MNAKSLTYILLLLLNGCKKIYRMLNTQKTQCMGRKTQY